MAIEVRCSNGHTLRVTDACVGRSFLCPHCRARVQVPNPKPVHEDDHECVLDSPRYPDEGDTVYVFRRLYDSQISSGSSTILKKIKFCEECGNSASYSFSNCPRCGTPLSTSRLPVA